MIINWLKNNTVRLETPKNTVVINPDKGTRGKASIVSFTKKPEGDALKSSLVKDASSVVITPGEYSFNKISLTAHGARNKEGEEETIQRMIIDGMSIMYVGNNHEPEGLDELPVDILLLAIEGTSLTVKQALEMTKRIEPRIVLPLAKESEQKLFSKEIGANGLTRETKLVIKQKQLPAKNTQTILLSS